MTPILADMDFPRLNTFLLTAIGLVTGIATIITQVRSKNARNAIELLRVEMTASKERGDRLESERNEYREKLHAAVEASNVIQLENAELRASRDFKPVLAFLETLQKQQADMNTRMLSALEGNTKVLTRIETKWGAPGTA